MKLIFALSMLSAYSMAQESTPPKLLEMPIKTCTVEAGCTTENTKLTLDANWRWYYHPSNHQNCFDNGYKCTNDAECADCFITGLKNGDYDRYGITTNNGALTMSFADNPAGNIGARMYLMNTQGTEYRKVDHTSKLEQELSMDVEIDSLGCGLNGAVYYSEMLMDGGKARDGNQGAPYGTGYCDAQCPKDLHHVGGKVNWRNEAQCCNEMDIWEANSISNAFTPHTCTDYNPFTGDNDETEDMKGPAKCITDLECGIGDRYSESLCDKDGCDVNPYRMGNTDFYGPGKTVDSNRKFTMTTQFFTDDRGDLVEIRRQYYQRDSAGNLKKYETPSFKMNGRTFDSITDDMCTEQQAPATTNGEGGGFASESTFLRKGGLKEMGESFKRGMVLIFSLWDDGVTNMSWLDSTAESMGLPGLYGQSRGTCGNQAVDRSSAASRNAKVTYSNVRLGAIGSTDPFAESGDDSAGSGSTASPTTTTTTTPPTTLSPSAAATAPPTNSDGNDGTCVSRWGACTSNHNSCCDGLVCHVQSQWYAQCLTSCPAGKTCVGGSGQQQAPPTPQPTIIVSPSPTYPSIPPTSSSGGSSSRCPDDSTPTYESDRVYLENEQVQYEGRIFKAMWYTKGRVPTTGGAWEMVSICDPTLIGNCGGVPVWDKAFVYQKGREAVYANTVYRAKWWSFGNSPPSEANSWERVRAC